MEKGLGRFFTKKSLYNVILIIICLALNLLLSFLARKFSYPAFPLYLDCVGTAFAVLLGGLLPGVIVGFATNLINSAFASGVTLYYGTVSVIFALLVRLFFMRGYFRVFYKRLLACIPIAVICGFLGGSITWLIYGMNVGGEISALLAGKLIESWSASPYLCQVLAEVFIDLADKTIVIFTAYLLFFICPKKIKTAFDASEPAAAEKSAPHALRGFFHTLPGTVTSIMLLFDILLCAAVAGVSYYMYKDTNVQKYSLICEEAVRISKTIIDADKAPGFEAERKAVFEEFLKTQPAEVRENPDGYPENFADYWDFAHGKYSEEYLETERKLYEVFDVYGDLEYLYVYHIAEDGCHVVFDLDKDAFDPFVPFDESFEETIPDLLKGNEIDPIITDDTYGWLLTVYKPLFDSSGNCVCYVCADISMNELRVDQMVFIVKVTTLVIGLSIVALIIILNIFNNRMVVPIMSISAAASEFAFDTEEGQQSSVNRINGLDIKSSYEIEKLYGSLKKLSNDSIEYIDELERNAKTIARLQEGIIMDFANMVENRDQCTGDHIKKTSYYVGCIANELKLEGKYADILTDDYISSIIRSAPLHDIGKIKISDVILNKPGRLNEQEFEIMKSHTTAGYEILKQTIVNTLDSDYLKEAINMAYCHHEMWDGRGYPRGLKGEEIPLSARIMAVADVFDALLSRRSYKEPYDFDKAVSIIKEEAGTHFDPVVVEAFINITNSLKEDS